MVTRLRIRRCGCSDLTIVVNGGRPTRRECTQLVRVFLSDADIVRLVEVQRQLCGFTRVHGLNRVRRLRLPIVGQFHDGGDGHLRGRAVRSCNSDGDGALVTRLSVCRRGGSDYTGVRVDLVIPAVNLLLGDWLVIVVNAEGELRPLRSVLDLVIHSFVRAGDLDVVGRSNIALEHNDGALDLLRLVGVVVVCEHRNVQDVALGCCPRDRSGDLASGLVDLDGPRTAIVSVGELRLAVLEGVALRGFIGRVATQATLGKRRRQGDLVSGSISHRVVIGDLDVHDRLELDLNLIRGLVRVSSLHLRSNDGARCDGIVCLRGDLAGLIDGDGPAFRHSGRVDLELGWVNWLVALHDGLGAHLGGQILANLALREAGAHQVSDLGVVRVDHDEQLELISGTVGVLNNNLRARESARLRVFWGSDGDVVVLVHLDGPALVDVLLVERDFGLETAVALLLR